MQGTEKVRRIAILGHGRSGKDTAAEWFRDSCGMRYNGSTSTVLSPFVAERLGLTPEEAFTRRHEDRELWFRIGNELRAADPLFLVRRVLAGSDIVAGLRDSEEVARLHSNGLVDLILWIERDVPDDPTMTYGPEVADVIIDNNDSLERFHARLAALARFGGLGSQHNGIGYL